MLINNPEALKSWLVIVLEPLCDADSSALARYVLALLKKDKPEKELKRVMIEQLDVFLGEETKPFVERLFDAITTGEYLAAPNVLPISNPIDHVVVTESSVTTEGIQDANVITRDPNDTDDVVPATEVTRVPNTSDNTSSNVYRNVDKIQTPPPPQIDENKTKDSYNHKTDVVINNNVDLRSSASAHYSLPSSSSVRTESTTATLITAQQATTNSSHVRSASPPAARAAADKENQPRDSRRRRASLRSRSRSRSRSNERLSRRSRSRDRRANEREKNQRQFRNKSPPISHDRRRGSGGGGGNDRNRRIGSGNINSGGMMDDRSPRFGTGVGGGGGGSGGLDTGSSRKMTRTINRSNSRSRSPSLERGRSKGSPMLLRSSRGSPDRDRHHHTSSSIQHETHEKRQRCRDFDEKGYCVRGETCPWDHGVNPVVFEGINNSTLISMSLREYNPDAPDLWSRSTNPAGMVGSTPSALVAGGAAGVAAAGINPFTGAARPMVGVGAPGTVGFPHIGDKSAANGAVGALAADYARTAAGAAAGAGFRASAPMLPFPFNPTAVATPLQRELIPIPVVDASGGGVSIGAVGGGGGDVNAMQQQQQGKRRYELEDSVAIADVPAKRKVPLNSRLGPRMPSMQNNCSLELRKVPRGLNTIAHLNNHFAKFGKIVNIQISYDGDPEAAIVTFSTHAEANVAYRSTEAVLNNRFIKVFWHSQDAGTSGSGDGLTIPIGGIGGTGGGSGSGPRKNSQYHLNNIPAIPTPSADSAKIANTSVTSQSIAATAAMTVPPGTEPPLVSAAMTTGSTNSATVAATHAPPSASLRLKNNVARAMPPTAANVAIIRKKQEEQAKAVVQLANGLRKRKQELLQSYVKQMKSALELVERLEQQDPQRAKTLGTIKSLQETIDKLRKEIAAEQEQIQAQMQNQQQPSMHQQPSAKKTKEQQKKELLDIELELFAQQQEGNDTTAIQKRIEELQRSLGISPSSGAVGVGSPTVGKMGHFGAGGRGGGVNARGGGAAGGGVRASTYPEGSTRVDRRPKTIVVTGFTSEEADFVLGHFKHFGEIMKHDVDREIPQLILSYATRISAEQAVVRGKLFKDKRLQISWAPIIQPANATTPNTVGEKKIASGGPLEGKTGNVSPTVDVTNTEIGSTTAEAAAATATTTITTAPIIGDKANISDADSIVMVDTIPELRLEDEEEDEESEDRTWRR